MKLRLAILGVCVLYAAWLTAQPAVTVVTSLTTTSTSADSLHVGCAIASSTCTGGIKAGPIAASGLVSSTAFGTFSFSGTGNGDQLLQVANGSAGASARAAVLATANVASGGIYVYSSANTPANGTLFLGTGSGGVIVSASHASGDLTFLNRAGTTALTLGASQLATFTGLVGVPNGAVGTPSLNFAGDADNGLYYIGTNNWGLTAGGTKVVDLSATVVGLSAITTNTQRYNSATGQPGFLAYNSASDATQATGATVDFDTEIYDNGGNFSADTFTVPVTGQYLFTACVTYSTGSATQGRGASIIVSGADTGYDLTYVDAVPTTSISVSCGSVIAPMTAADTAKIFTNLSTGTATVVGSNSGTKQTYFSGRLMP